MNINWQDNLRIFEEREDLESAIELVQWQIKENPKDCSLYIRVLWLLFFKLVQEQFPKDEKNPYAILLKKYFDISLLDYASDAEYLFFTGSLLPLAEWYCGLDEKFVPTKDTLAVHMLKKACRLEPHNPLFEWALAYQISDYKRELELLEIVYPDDSSYKQWLKNWGMAGGCIIELINRSYKRLEHN